MPEILFADEAVVVCLKPVGALSQGEGANALPVMLQTQLGGELFPVHRLDQPVGGVIVLARTREAAARLSAAVQTDSFGKEYLAVLDGTPEAPEGELHDLLYFDRSRNKSFVVRRKRAGVKDARLSYRTLGAAGGLTLVSVRLQTGRTHQIRVQLASRGTPLLGDGKYGSRSNRCSVALWSQTLRFAHPLTGEPLTFSAQPPQTYPWTLFSGQL